MTSQRNTNPSETAHSSLHHPRLTPEQKKAAAAYVLRRHPDCPELLEVLGLDHRKTA